MQSDEKNEPHERIRPVLFGKGAECEDCLIRKQHGQPTFMRVKHTDKGIILPTGKALDERCEACGGARRVPYPRSW